MKPLNEKQFKQIQKKMAEKGVYNVIDAQNRKGRHLYYKGVKTPEEVEVLPEDFQDEVMEKLSMKPEEISELLKKIDNPDKKVKIEDIDWKKVRSI